MENLDGAGRGCLYVQHDILDKNDWNFRVRYEITQDGDSDEFQADGYLTGRFRTPLELVDNEFEELEDAYRYAAGITMSEEYGHETLAKLLEKDT